MVNGWYGASRAMTNPTTAAMRTAAAAIGHMRTAAPKLAEWTITNRAQAHKERKTKMNTETTNETTAHRITARQAMRDSGMSLGECMDGVCPACCSEGCMTEPDGTCEHGFPSVLLACGMI